MSTHKEQFWDLMKEVNSANVNYVVIRGFSRLPDSADNDIDMVSHYLDFEKCKKIISSQFAHHYTHNYGFAEYSEMNNCSYKSHGPDDVNIAERRFYVDINSSLFFLSPYNNFTTRWTVSHDLNERVYETKVKKEYNEGYIWVPSPECELTLQILRNVLDNKGVWKPKSKVRIAQLIKEVDFCILEETISLCLPNSGSIVEALKKNDLTAVKQFSLGER